MGLSHNGENPDKGHAIFLGVQMWTLEIQIPSLRVALTTRMADEEKHRLCLQELQALDDKCLRAQQQIELYQAWIFRAFNKKVRE